MTLTRQMMRAVGQTRGEDQTVPADATGDGRGAQRLERAVAGSGGEPERGGRHRAEDRAPGIERGGVDLERVVEGAEHRTFGRQPVGLAGQELGGERLTVARLEGVG